MEALRDEFGLPGMRVLQFGFGADPALEKHLPHRFVPHCVVYTGTHDNDTTAAGSPRPTSRPRSRGTRSWPSGPSPCRYLNTDGAEIHWDMIRLAFSSVADTAIIPLQDILGLDQPRADEHAGQRRKGTGDGGFARGSSTSRA